MQNHVKLSPRPGSRVAPRVDPRGLRVPDHVEDLDFALPHGLVAARLVHRNGLDPRSLAAVKVADGIDERGKAGGVHRPNVATSACAVHAAHRVTDGQIRTVPEFAGLLAHLAAIPCEFAEPFVHLPLVYDRAVASEDPMGDNLTGIPAAARASIEMDHSTERVGGACAPPVRLDRATARGTRDILAESRFANGRGSLRCVSSFAIGCGWRSTKPAIRTALRARGLFLGRGGPAMESVDEEASVTLT